MFCKKCGKELREDALFCPHFGANAKENQKPKKKWNKLFFAVAIVMLIGVGGFAVAKRGSSSHSGTEQKVVESKTKKGKAYKRYKEMDGKIEVYLLSDAREFEFSYEEDEKEPLEKELVYRERFSYDDKGLRVESIREDEGAIEGGKPTGKIQYTYTDQNKLETEKFESGIYTDHYYGRTTAYYYDKNNNLEAVTEDDGNVRITSYYDVGRGHKTLIEESHYKEGWSGKERLYYEYNDNGFVTKQTSDIGTEKHYTYNKDNQVIKIEKVHEDKWVEELSYEYDEKGRLIRQNGDRFQYDKKGRLHSVVSDLGNTIRTSVFTYNQEGLVQEFTESYRHPGGEEYGESKDYVNKIVYDAYKNPVKISQYDELEREIGRIEMKYEPHKIEKSDWELIEKEPISDKKLCSFEGDYYWHSFVVNQLIMRQQVTNATGEMTYFLYLLNENRLKEALMLFVNSSL